MPWTFSHPAAMVPLRRLCPRYLNLAALVVGSVAPDLGYYLPRSDLASFAHGLRGSLLIAFPSGMLLLLVLYLVRRPICYLLPAPHRNALLSLCDKDRLVLARDRLLVVVVSLLLGIWSHILWDSFTHRAGWFVGHIQSLREPVFYTGLEPFERYYVLQQVSTIAGVAILVVTYTRWVRSQHLHSTPRHPEAWRYALLFAIIFCTLVFALPLAYKNAEPFHGFLAVRVFLFRTAVVATSFGMPLLILIGFIAYARRNTSS